MFQGLRTVVYKTPDLERGKSWYAEILGSQPYFDEPFYVGFNVGGYELGLDPNMAKTGPGVGGAQPYWGVSDADTAFARLVELGATPHTPVQDVGEGIRVATLLDPFGNLIGIIENPHFSLPTA